MIDLDDDWIGKRVYWVDPEMGTHSGWVRIMGIRGADFQIETGRGSRFCLPDQLFSELRMFEVKRSEQRSYMVTYEVEAASEDDAATMVDEGEGREVDEDLLSLDDTDIDEVKPVMTEREDAQAVRENRSEE